MDSDESRKSNRQKEKKSDYRKLQKLERIVKVKFNNKSLFKRALTHSSFVNESGQQTFDNERLEYLGDSVLALVVNEYLYKKFEEYPEGDLAKIKSAVVSEVTLAKVARDINLGSFLFMGRGEELSGGRQRASILANTLEALIGAVYLDSGLKTSKRLVLGLLKKHIERIDSLTYLRDPKTTLQEYVQKSIKERPVYEVIEENGPDHQKSFTVRLVIHEKEIVRGGGSSKRKAERDAAMKALELIYEKRLKI